MNRYFYMRNSLNSESSADKKADTKYFYGVYVTDESAFLQLEKRNLPPSLLTKIFLEKELRGVGGVLPASKSYINWAFESNTDIRATEYSLLPDHLNGDDGLSLTETFLKTQSDEKLKYLLGNQRWRQLFLSGRNLATFYSNVGGEYKNYDDAREFFDLDYYSTSCFQNVRQEEEAGKMEYLTPFQASQVIKDAGWKYGGGGGGRGDMMFAEAEMMEDKAMPMAGEEEDGAEGVTTTATSAAPNDSATSTDSDEKEEKPSASDEAKNDIDLESEASEDNTVFFSKLGWNTEDKVSFKLPSSISKFRVMVFAISSDGRIGVHTDFLETQEPFTAQADVPLYLYSQETLSLSVALYNNMDQTITVTNDFTNESPTSVSARDMTRLNLDIRAADLPVTVTFTSSSGEKSQIKIAPVVKQGLSFRYSKNYKAVQTDSGFEQIGGALVLPQNLITGSLDFSFQNVQVGSALILKGYEGLVREPSGCFEQTSSTSFPMVILLQYLNTQTNLPNQDKVDEMKFDIQKKLKKAVERLLSFETSTGGFEWFGESPGHVTLTAYGLWQFKEMNMLGDYVSLDVLDRTLSWLRKHYSEPQAEFPLSQGVDSFGNPPQTLSDIYILFVMSMFEDYHVSFMPMVDAMIAKFEASSTNSEDPYQIAFVGMLYLNLKQYDKARALAAKLAQSQDSDSGKFDKAASSITLSRGVPLSVETTALAAIFLAQTDFDTYHVQVKSAVDFIMANMQMGAYGSTQATILALKAMVIYSQKVAGPKSESEKLDIVLGTVSKEYEVLNNDDPEGQMKLTFPELNDTSQSEIEVKITGKRDWESGTKYYFTLEYGYYSFSSIFTYFSLNLYI